MSTISLNKSLRTTKVTPGPGEYADTFRRFTSANNACFIKPQLVAADGRNVDSLYGGLSHLYGLGGCGESLSEYRISVENVLRPQYSNYLNVPLGLMETVSEYPNKPRYDAMGVNRGRALGLEPTYQSLQIPTEQQYNANNDTDWMKTQGFFVNAMNRVNEDRYFANSVDVMKSGMY